MALGPFSIGTSLVLQNKMRWLRGREGVQSLLQEHADSSLIIDCECFTTPGAEPEVFHTMSIRVRPVLAGKLLEAEKTSLTVIKIGVAIRMGAFQVHQLRVAASPMSSHTHLTWKIRSGYRIVKLNNFMLRI